MQFVKNLKTKHTWRVVFFGYGSLLEASGESNMTTALAKTVSFKLLLNKEVSAKKKSFVRQDS